jgi:alkane 1-monooxygenase
MMSTVPYYILAAITFAGFFSLSSHAFVFIAIIYSILPLLDEFVSMDWKNPTRQERQSLEDNNFWFKFVLYVTAILDWVLFFKTMEVYANYEFTPFSILNIMGLVYIFSNLQSAQFAIAHEIFHKQSFLDRFFGTVHMSKLLYMHFTYEHLWGHHKRVATP